MLVDPNFLLSAREFKRGYDSAFRGVMEAHGLTRNEVDVLLFLANNPGFDTARDIVELRGMTKSHVCQSVDSLTRRGWLAAGQDSRDRRLVHLALGPGAGEAVQAAQQAQQRFFQRLGRGFTPAEREELTRLLQKLRENMKEGPEHA